MKDKKLDKKKLDKVSGGNYQYIDKLSTGKTICSKTTTNTIDNGPVSAFIAGQEGRLAPGETGEIIIPIVSSN